MPSIPIYAPIKTADPQPKNTRMNVPGAPAISFLFIEFVDGVAIAPLFVFRAIALTQVRYDQTTFALLCRKAYLMKKP